MKEQLKKNHVCLGDVPDRFKTLKMCLQALEIDPCCLHYVPDWYITKELYQKLIDKGKDVSEIEYIIEDWKERKRLKKCLKYELMPVAWHPDRVVDWCFDEDEKRNILGKY